MLNQSDVIDTVGSFILGKNNRRFKMELSSIQYQEFIRVVHDKAKEGFTKSVTNGESLKILGEIALLTYCVMDVPEKKDRKT